MKKKNKKSTRSLYTYSLYILPIFIIGIIGIAGLSYYRFSKSLSDIKKEPLTQETSIETKSKIIYPKQYSDSHITENAIKSDKNLELLALSETEEYYHKSLASIIYSIKSGTGESMKESLGATTTTEKENGIWLWTPLLLITPEYRSQIINTASRDGIKNIYLSLDSYLDIFAMPKDEARVIKKEEFTKSLELFLREAAKKNISVDAEAGWRNWAEDGHTYKALAIMNYVEKYNKTHDLKIRGIQYDIEPYLLEEYKKDDAGKKKVLTNFLDLTNQIITLLDGSELQLSLVIPEFYDGTNEETPSFKYQGKKGFATDHLMRILERRKGSKVIIMAYRNFSTGFDGSIEISQNEIDLADKYSTKIVIAQETGDVEPPYITFHNTSKKYFNKQQALIQKAFESNKSFDGFATHYINAFMTLK